MEKKLFEIPIYGINPNDLLLKYESKRQHFREKYVSKNGNGNPVKVEEYVNLVCHPHLLCIANREGYYELVIYTEVEDWRTIIEGVTVYADGRMIFRFADGREEEVILK